MMEGKEYELLKTGIKYFIRQAHEQSNNKFFSKIY